MRTLSAPVAGSLSLVGRDKEQKVIFDVYEGVLQKRNEAGSSQILVVSGKSGVGKSALVESLRRSVKENSSRFAGIFTEAKFDQHKQRVSRPYCALIDSVETMLRHLRSSTEKWDSAMKVLKEHEQGTRILCSMFPSLRSALGYAVDVEVEQVKSAYLAELLRRFFRLITQTLNQP
eukprot:CAMPEP_0116869618 /NCGR_PEP_ID=MMETSP0418-20121206/27858_1 /TAXON_ID=1158023 /ORGANISM="Astrosyne radiata, Strain 13vi08-1A" /LENGTH=175 /DNA_ID=CAMNT_0004505731 /DNA_START=413 /DNA_END=936 /DNA_ORIENTATION=+